jgi:hypothetical protein
MPDIRKTFASILQRFIPHPNPERMIIGRPDGVIYPDPTNQPYTIYVTNTASGVTREVINRLVRNNAGTAVLVGYHPWLMPTRLQVLGYADLYADANWMGPEVMNHAQALHGFGKPDCDWIERERILYAVPVPGQLKIDIYPDAKQLADGTWWWSALATRVDFSAAVPDTGAAVAIVVLNASGTPAVRVGATITGTREDLTKADFPVLTPGDSAFVGIKVYAGMCEAHHEYGYDDLIPMEHSGAYAGTTSAISELTTDVVAVGPGIAATTIQPGVVSNSKLANMTGPTVKGRSSGTGAPEDLSISDMLALGFGVFGGAIEDLSAQVDGSETHFTFSDPAYAIWVFVDQVIQLPDQVTFTSGDSEFDLDIAPSASSSLLVARLVPTVAPSFEYPVAATMWHDQSRVISGNALSIVQDGNQRYAHFAYQSTSSVNDVFETGFVISAGTYTLAALGLADSNCGKPEVFVDGVSVGTMDFYAAGTTYNAIKTIANVTLTAGYHKIEFKCSSKNGASSGFNLPLTKIYLLPGAY